MSATPPRFPVSRRQLGWLLVLLAVAFGLRALFTLYVMPAVNRLPAPYAFAVGDATSYMWAVENLIDKGRFSFDLLEPDAAFGRLPGYPLFYGLHYLIFGPVKAIYATAWTQVVLDTLAVLLVFGTLRRLAPASWVPAWIGAVLYATYPFILLWVPMVFTELLATDLLLLMLYWVAGYDGRAWSAVKLGLLTAAGLFTREYLGVMLPILGLWLLYYHGGLGRAAGWRAAVLLGLGFGVLYAPWPIRNYLNYHRLMLLKPKTAGYASHKEDIDEYRSWVHSWTNDENPWIEAIAKANEPLQFPAEVFADATEAARAQQLVALARHCGSSFFMQRENSGSAYYGLPKDSLHFNRDSRALLRINPAALRSIYTMYRDTGFMMHDTLYLRYRNHNCNAAIGDGFRELRASYVRRHPVAYWLHVPVLNLRKAFFKSGLMGAGAAGSRAKLLAVSVVFGYRSLLLLLGWAGVWRYRRLPVVQVVGWFAGFMVLFVCFGMRNLEMRYLLQADVALLLPAALLLGGWLDRYRRTRPAGPLVPVAA